MAKQKAASLAGASVYTGEAAVAHELGVGVFDGRCGGGQLDADHATVDQGLEFGGLADAVLVQITPDAHGGELGVGGAEEAVVVAVEVAQSGEAVGGLLPAGQHGFVAEQLGAVVDDAVGVTVKHDEAVVSARPGGGCLEAVAVGIELDGSCIVEPGDFKAVAVEVEDQRVDVLDGLD